MVLIGQCARKISSGVKIKKEASQGSLCSRAVHSGQIQARVNAT